MNWVGDAWESGVVQVYQEHFTSDHVRAVLADTWRSLAPSAAATVVCATVPGELHDLGVHMAAVAVASASSVSPWYARRQFSTMGSVFRD